MKKFVSILLVALVLGTCCTTMAYARKKATRKTTSSTVNLYSKTCYSGIFHYREVIRGGAQIRDYLIGISCFNEDGMPPADATMLDVYNNEKTFLKGDALSKNTLSFYVSENEDSSIKEVRVTYLSKDKIKVVVIGKDYKYSDTYKKIAGGFEGGNPDELDNVQIPD